MRSNDMTQLAMRATPLRHKLPVVGSVAASGFSALGNAIALVALPWFVLSLTGSALWSGVAVSVGIAPMIIGLLIGGAMTDRYGPRWIAFAGDMLSAAATAAVPVLYHMDALSIHALITLIALGAIMDGPAAIAGKSRHPELARLAGMRLERVKSADELIEGMSLLAGPAIAGGAIALIGMENTLWLTAGCSFIGALLNVFSLPGRSKAAGSRQSATSLAGAREGLRFLVRDPLLRSLILLGTLFGIAFGAFELVIMPAFFKSNGLSPLNLGLFLSAAGGGGIVGTLVYAAWGHRVSGRTFLLIGCIVETIVVFALSWHLPMPATIAAGAIAGFATGPIGPLVATTTLRRVPLRLRGRVLGLTDALEFSAIPIGVLLAGVAVELLGPSTVLALTALALAALTLLAASLPGLKLLDSEQTTAPSGTAMMNPNPDTNPSASRPQRKRVSRIALCTGAVVALVASAIIVWEIWNVDAKTTASTSAPVMLAPTVTTEAALARRFDTRLTISGTLAARNEILIGTAVEGQRVAEVLIEEGDHVSAGQILVRLETDVLEAQCRDAESRLAQARSVTAQQEALLKESRSRFRRAEQLRAANVFPQEEYDQRQSTFQSQGHSLRAAQAERVQAEAQLAEAQARLARAVIRAPVSGQISERLVRPGELAGGGPLLRLIGDGEVDFEAEVPEADLPLVRSGQTVKVRPAGLTEPIDGQVRIVAPKVNVQSRFGTVRVTLPTHSDLRPGVFARGEIEIRSSEALAVRQSALVDGVDDGTTSVLIVDQEGLAHRRVVATGMRRDGYVEIRSGLEAGDIVISKATAFVRDGDRVTPEPLASNFGASE